MATSHPSSPAATTVPTQQSAATRVFAVPELLEEILFILTTLGPKRESGLSIMYGHAADDVLFAVQRVNKAFLHTIQGSAKLRRQIFLAPHGDEDSDRYCSDHQPLLHFCQRMEVRDESNPYWAVQTSYYDNKPDFSVFGREFPTLQFDITSTDYLVDGFANTLATSFSPAWRRPEASWRSIKICNSPTPKSVEFKINTQIGRADGWLGTPTASWILPGDTTFGEVYQLTLDFLETADQILEEQERGKKAIRISTLALMTAKLGDAPAVSINTGRGYWP